MTRRSLGDVETQFLHFFFTIKGPTKGVQVALVTSLSMWTVKCNKWVINIESNKFSYLSYFLDILVWYVGCFEYRDCHFTVKVNGLDDTNLLKRCHAATIHGKVYNIGHIDGSPETFFISKTYVFYSLYFISPASVTLI